MGDTITVQSDNPIGEGWNWRKFFGGFFNGLNLAKAFVNLWHTAILVVIVWGVAALALRLWNKYHKPKVAPVPICVTTNNGQIHSSSDDNKRKFSLINIFS